ncbi:subtilase family protein [Murinocardiopsis flavida]|uniref:Subtilase family protein n=1 Tax=Murinocardiopsis flavida TaxID=645275 RepID=A0A2P8DR04_9ACTN|nr:S8 family serine peptidase [Murinocardiopsis flavida]PSK99651.1 subtilase family protein [Murinocardiopsis flavida]
MRARRAAIAAATAVLLSAHPAAADTGGGLRMDQWGLDTVGAAEAWRQSEGSGVTVAVLDTGVRDDHPDLTDAVTHGDDTTGQDRDPGDPEYGDRGTRTAGLVAARGHGREHTGGVMGVAPDARILSVRVAADADDPKAGGVAEDAQARGVRSAVADGAQVIALTAGPVPKGARAGLSEAVGYARRNGVVVVQAAGPGAPKGALSVRSAAQGAAAGGGGLSAPGEQVETTKAGGGYGTASGNGAAAAFAAGTAALIRSAHPQLRPSQVAEAITKGADNGMLSAPGALDAAGATAKDVPAFDPDLADETEDSAILPAWAFWLAGGVLAVILATVGVFLLRRTTSNPYDLPPRADGSDGPEQRDPPRRRGRGRRRAASRR